MGVHKSGYNPGQRLPIQPILYKSQMGKPSGKCGDSVEDTACDCAHSELLDAMALLTYVTLSPREFDSCLPAMSCSPLQCPRATLNWC